MGLIVFNGCLVFSDEVVVVIVELNVFGSWIEVIIGDIIELDIVEWLVWVVEDVGFWLVGVVYSVMVFVDEIVLNMIDFVVW